MGKKQEQEEVREEQEQAGEEQEQAEEECSGWRKFWHEFWHRMIQLFVVIFATRASVSLVTCTPIREKLETCDLILFLGMILAIALGVICSHAYNYYPGSEKSLLRDQAAKKQATWLHANFCWKIVGMWMTITSLYCNCATIYISGSKKGDSRILIYSILSLVLSLGIYVIRPSNRAEGYRKAYLLVTEALVKDDQEEIKKAIIDGEKNVEKQDTMSPG